MRCKTRRARLARAVRRVAQFCRRNRHRPVKEQHARLASRLRGHFNYFGVNGNIESLMVLYHRTKKLWKKWLGRRSQRTNMTWERFGGILQTLPLPRPQLTVKLWA